jgi:hypothetical protein
LRKLGFTPFRWFDDGGRARVSQPTRLALHPMRFGFCREAVFLLLTKTA